MLFRLVQLMKEDHHDYRLMVLKNSIHLNLYWHYCVEVNNYCPSMDLMYVNDYFRKDDDIQSMHHFHFHHFQSLWSERLNKIERKENFSKFISVRFFLPLSNFHRRSSSTNNEFRLVTSEKCTRIGDEVDEQELFSVMMNSLCLFSFFFFKSTHEHK